MRPARLVAPLALVALLALLGWGLLRPTDPNSRGGPLVGKPAPRLALATLQGGELDLARLRGRPVILNFWASWCLPCRDEAPMLRQAQVDGAAYGLVVVGVVVNDTPDKARAFAEEFGLNYPNLIDPAGRAGVEYGVTGVPETFFIDRSGVIVAKKFGPLTAGDLEARLAELR